VLSLSLERTAANPSLSFRRLTVLYLFLSLACSFSGSFGGRLCYVHTCLKPKSREFDAVLRGTSRVDITHHGTRAGIAWEQLGEVKDSGCYLN